jgi:hypothetical protein
MKAIKAIKDDRFYFEARAIMEEHDLPYEALETVYAERKHRAFMEEIDPYQKQISSIMSISMPAFLVVDGKIECKGDGLTESLREIVVQYRATIADIAFKYYGERSLPPNS